MTTTQIAPLELTIAPVTPGVVGNLPQRSEELSDLQLLQMQNEARELEAKAFEIEALANRMAGDPELTDEADHAKTQALAMRGTAESVKIEIHSAPTDRQTGKKKMQASRVATLMGALEQGIHAADLEKKSLIESISDAAHGASSHKAATKTVTGTEGNSVTSSIRKICQLPKVTAGTVAADTAVKQASGLMGWMKRTQESVTQTATQASNAVVRGWKNISETAQQAWENFSPLKTLNEAAETVTQTAKSVTNTVVAAAVATKDYVVVAVEVHFTKPAVALAKSAVSTAREAYGTTSKAVGNQVDKAKTAIADARSWVSDSIAEKKQWMASLFADEKPTANPVVKQVVAKAKAPAPANDNMIAALKQAAAALTLPMALNGQAVADMLSFSTPNLPKINATLAHLPSFY